MKLVITWALAMALSLTVHAQTTSNLINPAGTAWGIPGNQVMGISGITAVEGGGPTTGSAYYNSETNTIRFGYNSSTVAQTIAINQALSGTGIQVGGFNWNYQWMNGGYSSSLDDFIQDRPQIKLWTHGHTHEDFDYMIAGCRILCNPRGYVNYEERADTWKLVTVEV